MFVNSDFSDLLRLFNNNGVKYLVIGGYAVIQHTEPRFTKDLDLWISTDTANAKAVYKSLKEFGAPLTGLTEADFSEEGYFYQMGVPPVRIDILMVYRAYNSRKLGSEELRWTLRIFQSRSSLAKI